MVLLVSSGKDTFCNRVKELMPNGYCYIYSTIDFVKQVASSMGWSGEKTPRSRKLLSELKNLMIEYDDIPFKKMVHKVKSTINDFNFYNCPEKYEVIIFIMCREPSEIEKLKKELNAKTIFIHSEKAENKSNNMDIKNTADSNIFNYNYDIIIENDGSMSQFYDKIYNFIIDEGLGYQMRQLQFNLFGDVVIKD